MAGTVSKSTGVVLTIKQRGQVSRLARPGVAADIAVPVIIGTGTRGAPRAGGGNLGVGC